jgi:maltose O-acetyltransferase
MRGTKIERNVTFGFQVFLEDLHPELITIKEGADIGPRVTVLTNDSVFFHLGDPALYKVRTKEVIIGKNCYVGAGAIILPGVIIGDNTIIAAGSIVTKSIPPESVAMGIPARVVCSREEWARNHPFKP